MYKLTPCGFLAIFFVLALVVAGIVLLIVTINTIKLRLDRLEFRDSRRTKKEKKNG